jgi:hypothetical protein
MSDPMTIATTALASFNHVTNLVKTILNTTGLKVFWW